MKAFQRFVVWTMTVAMVSSLAPAPTFAMAEENLGENELPAVVDDGATSDEDQSEEAADQPSEDEESKVDETAEQGAPVEPEDSLEVVEDKTEDAVELDGENPDANKAQELKVGDEEKKDDKLLKAQDATNLDPKNVTRVEDIQPALDMADGSSSHEVVIKAGNYTISRGLYIKSNTKLTLESGATIKRASGFINAMVNCGAENQGSYAGAKNVTITGGTWDSNGDTTGTILHFECCSGITVSNATFQNCKADHTLLLDGVNGATINKCTFKNCMADAKHHSGQRFASECVHIDSTPGNGTETTPHKGGLASQNVTVNGCTFDTVCCAVGSHYHGDGDPKHSNIKVTNNTVSNLQADDSAVAFTCANSTGWVLKGNKLNNGGGKGWFANINGCKNFTISGNTATKPAGFVNDAYSAASMTSNGTLSGNKATGLTKNAVRSYGIASTLTLSGETYSMNRTYYAKGNADNFLIYKTKGSITVKNCNLSSATTSINVQSGSYISTLRFDYTKLVFENNTVDKMPGIGVYACNLYGNSTIKSNTIKGSGYKAQGTDRSCIVVEGGTGTYYVQYNKLYNCRGDGIYLNQSKKCKVNGNIIYAPRGSQDVRVYGGSGHSIYNNGPTFQGATYMPVGSTATYTLGAGSLSTSNGSIFGVKGKTVTAKKVGTAYVVQNYNGRKYNKQVHVVSIHGKTYEMQSVVNSNFVLDMYMRGTTNGTKMIVWKRNHQYNQRYQYYKNSDGTYCIRSLKSKKWLDVKYASTANQAPVIQWSWTGGKNQRWRISVDASNALTFTNAKSGKCFDVQYGKTVNGANIIQWTPNGGKNQKWRLVTP